MDEQREQIRKLNEHFTTFVEEIDHSHLRKMQADMFKCAANCCDNESLSVEKKDNCVKNCSVALENAHKYVQWEVGQIQDQTSHCVERCNVIFTPGGEPASLTSPRPEDNKFFKCMSDCIDVQCNSIQTIQENIKKVLASGKFNRQA